MDYSVREPLIKSLVSVLKPPKKLEQAELQQRQQEQGSSGITINIGFIIFEYFGVFLI